MADPWPKPFTCSYAISLWTVMVIFLAFLLTFSLLAGTVFCLHRYQKAQSLDSADRQSPLPPLPVARTVLIEPSTSNKEQDSSSASSTHWQPLYDRFKANGNYPAALALCLENFPQRKAFIQAARIIRIQIRNPEASQQQKQALLHQLYLIACQDSFIHDRLTGLNNLSRLQLQNLPPSAWISLDMPYQEIGYEQLTLLNKTDQRLIQASWDSPLQHQSAKIHHRKQWQNLLAIYADTRAGTLAG